MNQPLSYVHPTANSPWGTYISQVDRVLPYLGPLARWADTLRAGWTLPRIRALCAPHLGWSDARWEAEIARYRELIHTHYQMPDKHEGLALSSMGGDAT